MSSASGDRVCVNACVWGRGGDEHPSVEQIWALPPHRPTHTSLCPEKALGLVPRKHQDSPRSGWELTDGYVEACMHTCTQLGWWETGQASIPQTSVLPFISPRALFKDLGRLPLSRSSHRSLGRSRGSLRVPPAETHCSSKFKDILIFIPIVLELWEGQELPWWLRLNWARTGLFRALTFPWHDTET